MRQRSLWCRLYSEVARCRKIQTLPDAEFKFLINCWCLAKENDGALPSAADIAWNLHQPEADVAAMISSLKMKRFIDEKIVNLFLTIGANISTFRTISTLALRSSEQRS